MTVERATELVAALESVDHEAATDLAAFFVNHFGIEGDNNLYTFLSLAGYEDEVIA